MKELSIRNRQRTKKIDTRLLSRAVTFLLENELGILSYEIGILLVGPREMSRVNQLYLNHEGSTDVITFDHSESPLQFPAKELHGELYICVQDALEQATVFKTHWTSELLRYAIHGILHLQGFDDLDPASRKVMKRHESRLLKKISRTFPPGKFESLRAS